MIYDYENTYDKETLQFHGSPKKKKKRQWIPSGRPTAGNSAHIIFYPVFGIFFSQTFFL